MDSRDQGRHAAHLNRPRRGVALPGVLLIVGLLVSVSGWLIGHLRDDIAQARVATMFEAQDALAGAAVATVAQALTAVVDWRPVDSLGAAPACVAGPGEVEPIDAAAETAWAQAETDASSRWAADTPRWQLLWQCHAAGVLGRWPTPGRVPIVIVWVADDPEGDGVPSVSDNQRLLLRALAVGAGGARGIATATVERAAPGAPVRLVSWRPRAVG
jgi:hypothetical protein